MRENRETGPWLLQRYGQGGSLTCDVVVGAERIGNLTSFFKAVDGAVSLKRTGRRRFSLREAVQLLQAPDRQHDTDVARRHSKIKAYLALFAGPASNPVITIVEFRDDLVVVDGNHTGMAAYLPAISHPDPPYRLPVFVLTVPGSVLELG